MARSTEGNTDNSEIFLGVLQGNTLIPVLFIICRDYELQTWKDLMKVNSLILKTRSIRYSAKTTTDANYVDDLTLLENTPSQVKSLLHNLEQTEALVYSWTRMKQSSCFNEDGAISSLYGKLLKLVDQYTSIVISHRLKAMLTHALAKHGVLLIDYRLYGNLIYLIK